MVKLTIDGRELEAKEKAKVLDVARANNIDIPTMCAHEAVTPAGICRLCLVETTTKDGKNRVVPSCLTAVEEGMVVSTKSEKVVTERQTAMQKIMARAPKSVEVQEMAKKLGVDSTPLPLEDHQNCILCGLCQRVCEQVVGVKAISRMSRSTEPGALPYTVDFDACIACGSCVYVSPSGAISLVDSGDTRTITWPYQKKEFKLAKCSNCGRHWWPVKQIEYMSKKSGQPMSFFEKCPECR